jgi:hypothetical protein
MGEEQEKSSTKEGRISCVCVCVYVLARYFVGASTRQQLAGAFLNKAS